MFFNIFNKTKIIARCGHPVKRKTKVVVMGKKDKLTVADKNEAVELCPECMAKMAIRCARCGRIIYPGNPIAFWEPEEISREYYRYATLFIDDTHNVAIGCISRGCCEMALSTGFWVAPGKVKLSKDCFVKDKEGDLTLGV